MKWTELKHLAGAPAEWKESGAVATVSGNWKQDTVAYKHIPTLQGLDIDQYRGKAR